MKDVIIDIHGSQTDEKGAKDTIEYTTVGKYALHKGDYYILPEHNSTNLMGATTTLKVGESKVHITRKGKVKTDFTVEQDKRSFGHYDTGVGVMTVGVFGKSIHSSLGENGGEVFVRYAIDIDGGYLGINEVKLSIRGT